MFDAFTEAARRVIFFARLEAGRLGFDDIDTPHLLLGFINVDAGNGGALLQKLMPDDVPIEKGATVWNIQRPPHIPFLNEDTANRLRATFSHAGLRLEPLPMNADMPVTMQARRVFADASEHAGSAMVTPLHLLWAMLGEEQAELARAISELGVTREQIDEEIRRNGS